MAKSKTDAEVMEGLAADEEGNLGEIGGDPDMNMEQDHRVHVRATLQLSTTLRFLQGGSKVY